MQIRHLVVAALVCVGSLVHAQRLVVNNDEWTLINAGATNEGATNFNNFVTNLKAYLDSPSKPGCSMLAITTLVGQSSLSTQMAASPACTYTVNAAAPFTLSNLQNYDAVFLAGPITGVATGAAVAAVLLPYIAGGGNVYIAGGTGAFGGPVAEANYWNPTLNPLGLSMATFWSPVTSPLTDPVTGTHPLLAGVSQLYYDFGNPLSTTGFNTGARVIESGGNAGAASAVGLLAVYDRALDEIANPRVVPALHPGMLAMLMALIAGFAGRRFGRSRNW